MFAGTYIVAMQFTCEVQNEVAQWRRKMISSGVAKKTMRTRGALLLE